MVGKNGWENGRENAPAMGQKRPALRYLLTGMVRYAPAHFNAPKRGHFPGVKYTASCKPYAVQELREGSARREFGCKSRNLGRASNA